MTTTIHSPRGEKLSCIIGYRISSRLKSELTQLLTHNESFNSFARRMIDADRIIAPKDVSREMLAVAILENEKAHFDAFSKILWGIINQGLFLKPTLERTLTEHLIHLRRICHFLSLHVSKHPRPRESGRYHCSIDSVTIDKKSNNDDVVFDADNEFSRNTVSVSFRITNSLYTTLSERAAGSESVHQICRLMLSPVYKIQPVNLAVIGLFQSIETFYLSRISAMTRALEVMQPIYSDLGVKFVLIYRQFSTLKFLIDECLGVHIQVVDKSK